MIIYVVKSSDLDIVPWGTPIYSCSFVETLVFPHFNCLKITIYSKYAAVFQGKPLHTQSGAICYTSLFLLSHVDVLLGKALNPTLHTNLRIVVVQMGDCGFSVKHWLEKLFITSVSYYINHIIYIKYKSTDVLKPLFLLRWFSSP